MRSKVVALAWIAASCSGEPPAVADAWGCLPPDRVNHLVEPLRGVGREATSQPTPSVIFGSIPVWDTRLVVRGDRDASSGFVELSLKDSILARVRTPEVGNVVTSFLPGNPSIALVETICMAGAWGCRPRALVLALDRDGGSTRTVIAELNVRRPRSGQQLPVSSFLEREPRDFVREVGRCDGEVHITYGDALVSARETSGQLQLFSWDQDLSNLASAPSAQTGARQDFWSKAVGSFEDNSLAPIGTEELVIEGSGRFTKIARLSAALQSLGARRVGATAGPLTCTATADPAQVQAGTIEFLLDFRCSDGDVLSGNRLVFHPEEDVWRLHDLVASQAPVQVFRRLGSSRPTPVAPAPGVANRPTPVPRQPQQSDQDCSRQRAEQALTQEVSRHANGAAVTLRNLTWTVAGPCSWLVNGLAGLELFGHSEVVRFSSAVGREGRTYVVDYMQLEPR